LPRRKKSAEGVGVKAEMSDAFDESALLALDPKKLTDVIKTPASRRRGRRSGLLRSQRSRIIPRLKLQSRLQGFCALSARRIELSWLIPSWDLPIVNLLSGAGLLRVRFGSAFHACG